MKPTRIKRQKHIISFLICILWRSNALQLQKKTANRKMLQKPSKHEVNKTQHGGYGWEHLQYFCIKLKSV